MTDNRNIRGLIREKFNYLITDYDFVAVSDIDADDIYSEVRFKRNDWIILFVTIAHGTKISIQLVSPNDDLGFLSYYFNTVDKEYNETEGRVKNLGDSIRYYSEYLRTHGHDILTADSGRLTEIMELVQNEHYKWIKPLMKGHSDA